MKVTNQPINDLKNVKTERQIRKEMYRIMRGTCYYVLNPSMMGCEFWFSIKYWNGMPERTLRSKIEAIADNVHIVDIDRRISRLRYQEVAYAAGTKVVYEKMPDGTYHETMLGAIVERMA